MYDKNLMFRNHEVDGPLTASTNTPTLDFPGGDGLAGLDYMIFLWQNSPIGTSLNAHIEVSDDQISWRTLVWWPVIDALDKGPHVVDAGTPSRYRRVALELSGSGPFFMIDVMPVIGSASYER
jgi:hypothetical protein